VYQAPFDGSAHFERPRWAPAETDHRGGVIMGTWFWLNIPLALLFVCCWAGIPLWLTLTRWRAELNAKHAELAAETGPARVFAHPDRAVAHQSASPASAGVADAQPFAVGLRLPSEPGGAPATLVAAGPRRRPGI
jgi:hypothetical protein